MCISPASGKDISYVYVQTHQLYFIPVRKRYLPLSAATPTCASVSNNDDRAWWAYDSYLLEHRLSMHNRNAVNDIPMYVCMYVQYTYNETTWEYRLKKKIVDVITVNER